MIMTIGSHNTMTYLKPRKWWMWFGKFIAKCQKYDVIEQYRLGARWFDLRISLPYKNGSHEKPIFSHGLMDYKGVDVEDVLSYLASKSDAYCRIVLEKGDDTALDLFKFYVTQWKNNYPTLNITQIARKGEWKNILEPTATNPYGGGKDAYASANGYYPKYQNWPGVLRYKSWSGLLIDDLWPWIYAKLNNKKNLEKYKDEKITLLIDFVGI